MHPSFVARNNELIASKVKRVTRRFTPLIHYT